MTGRTVRRVSSPYKITVRTLLRCNVVGSVELDVQDGNAYTTLRRKAAKLLPHVRLPTLYRQPNINTPVCYLQLWFACPYDTVDETKFTWKDYQSFIFSKPKEVFVLWDEASAEKDQSLYCPRDAGNYVTGFIDKQGSRLEWPVMFLNVGQPRRKVYNKQ
jgi:hypothetical protein